MELEKVAKAESKVHNKPIEEIHFHEVGTIDSIVDIVGTAILINKINPDKVISSIVNDGYGFIECAHGTMSLPVPATSEIFASSDVKFKQILFKNGALDVFFTPIYMKKNRPAYHMTVACKRKDMLKLQNIIFKETTTIGLRYRFESRVELERKMVEVDTKYGKVKAKKVVNKNNGEEYIYPEYESIKEVALKNNVPLKELYNLVEKQ